MLAKINNIKPWQAALIIAILGFSVFFTGLSGPFRDDDLTQIVNNTPVHSISHIKLFFEGGTFYYGQAINTPLSGIYYRPLETTAYSLLYTIFGPHVLAFHLLQLALYIASAFLLYLVFTYSFKRVLALLLALIFLVHPLNSQVVYAIPSMADVLCFFFGILAFYLLLRYQSRRILIAVAASLFLAMLSKESAAVFIIMAALYLFWFNRQRLVPFIGSMVIPIGVYLALRINAVGLNAHEHVAPIDNLSLGGRLYTAPSIMLFYITKFIFPWRLATGYYWVHPSFSIRYVLLPLIIDLAVVGAFVYMGRLLHKRVSKAQYYTYLFFGIWAALGILIYLQIIPLDMTVFETWFYFPMAGVLGMIGVMLGAFHFNPKWLLIIGVILIAALGIRTAARGLDWRNPTNLAYQDIAASPDDFDAYGDIANSFIAQGHYKSAIAYDERSIAIYPTFTNYYDLGVDFTAMGNYRSAIVADDRALQYGDALLVYDNLCELTLLSYGNAASDGQLFTDALKAYPDNSTLWMYLAILEDQYNDNAKAQVAITQAARLGSVPQELYDKIMNNQPVTLYLANLKKTITVR